MAVNFHGVTEQLDTHESISRYQSCPVTNCPWQGIYGSFKEHAERQHCPTEIITVQSRDVENISLIKFVEPCRRNPYKYHWLTLFFIIKVNVNNITKEATFTVNYVTKPAL